MKIDVKYELSAHNDEQWPVEPMPEVVILGRSNSGKSSLINEMARRKVAKVSQLPGKTRALNFFRVNECYRWVDVPGYGWSKRDMKEMKLWRKLIETYLKYRPNLVGAVLIVDSRRTWDSDEALLGDWLTSREIPFIIAVNKCDKLNKNEKQKVFDSFTELSGTHVAMVSAQTGEGVEELEKMFYQRWVQPKLKRPRI